MIFGATMIVLASSEAHYGYPSFYYNQPQYYTSYKAPTAAYRGVIPSVAYQQQQQVGVEYGPIHYQPVVTSVRQVYYEPQPPQVRN
jgi:hypothetical protein